MATSDPKIVEYIKLATAESKSKEEMYKELLGQGWSLEAIQDGFTSLTSVTEKEDHNRKMIVLIVTIGAVLIGAGVFSFIAANWKEMTDTVKVLVILTSIVVSYGLGWMSKENMKLPRVGNALILLGAILYGAGIFLVAQIFNIRANWPDGFILWMIGIIVMAFAAESYGLFYFAIPLGIIAIVGHPYDLFGSFGSDPFLLTSSLLLLVATIITAVTGWVIRKRMPPELKEYY